MKTFIKLAAVNFSRFMSWTLRRYLGMVRKWYQSKDFLVSNQLTALKHNFFGRLKIRSKLMYNDYR